VLGMYCAISDAHDGTVLLGDELLAQSEMRARQQLQGTPSLGMLFPTLSSSTPRMDSLQGTLEEVAPPACSPVLFPCASFVLSTL